MDKNKENFIECSILKINYVFGSPIWHPGLWRPGYIMAILKKANLNAFP